MTTAILKKIVEHKKTLAELKADYPLSVARLWRPACCRFDGLHDKSERMKGCGKPMERLRTGIWHCSTCNITEARSAQSDPLYRLGTEATLIAGGNRSGKSQLACMLCVAVSAGLTWWVMEWLILNGLEELADWIPTEPSHCWFSSLSYSDALEYIRPKLDLYLPVGSKKTRWKSQDRASVLLPNGGKISSMSAESGREKFQGSSVRMVFMDEEQPESIFHECQLRTADRKGSIFLTMTPLKGLSWVYSAFIEPVEHPEGFEVHYLSGLDNPYVSSTKLRRTVQHMSKASQKSRLYGKFGSQEGLIYPEFQPNIHIIDPFPVPVHWRRFRAIDFGCSHPFVCLWLALEDENGRDCLHVYLEHYRKNLTTLENGKIIKELSGTDEYEWTVCDPESKDGRMTLARPPLHIYNRPAKKSVGVLESINWVKERLQLDVNGYPRLVVHSNCRNLIKEFRLYSWRRSKLDKPNKVFDDALDALRYQVITLTRYNMRL